MLSSIISTVHRIENKLSHIQNKFYVICSTSMHQIYSMKAKNNNIFSDILHANRDRGGILIKSDIHFQYDFLCKKRQIRWSLGMLFCLPVSIDKECDDNLNLDNAYTIFIFINAI